MRLLLDTHYLIWLSAKRERLSTRDCLLLEDPATHCIVSAMTIWELRIKWNRFNAAGERKGSLDPIVAMAFCVETGIELAHLTAEQCALPRNPAVITRDPFDEMLIAHAQQLDARLLTRDRLLIDHPIAYRF